MVSCLSSLNNCLTYLWRLREASSPSGFSWNRRRTLPADEVCVSEGGGGGGVAVVVVVDV